MKNGIKYMIIGAWSIFLVAVALILNWFFQITPYQKLEGMPLLIAPFFSIIGGILSAIAFGISKCKSAKWALVSHVILFISPFLYMYFGTLIFGP